VIRLEGIAKRYQMGDQTVHALEGIDLRIERNELVAFIGASGSGKSTMMNIVGCLDSPSAGQYWLNGREVATMSGDELARVRNREIGFIFQSFHLLPRASALDNVARPLIYRGVPPRERTAMAAQACASRSRARWWASPRSCWPMNRPATSTRRRPRTSCRSSTSCTMAARRSSW
jgi:putative ABC transport system ATP-binding protein